MTSIRPGTAQETIRARILHGDAWDLLPHEQVEAGRILRVMEGVYLAADGPATMLLRRRLRRAFGGPPARRRSRGRGASPAAPRRGVSCAGGSRSTQRTARTSAGFERWGALPDDVVQALANLPILWRRLCELGKDSRVAFLREHAHENRNPTSAQKGFDQPPPTQEQGPGGSRGSLEKANPRDGSPSLHPPGDGFRGG